MWPCSDEVTLRCAAGENKVKAFLVDWWMIFWEIYSLRLPSKYFKVASTNPEVRAVSQWNTLLSCILFGPVRGLQDQVAAW